MLSEDLNIALNK